MSPGIGRSRHTQYAATWQQAKNAQKKARLEAGREALLLSHIKAPAQGGKAGSGKPPEIEFNKFKQSHQAIVNFFLH